MEQVLDICKLCQLIPETRLPLPARGGVAARHDYEYERCGVCNVFIG
jgi:hypothetical protein